MKVKRLVRGYLPLAVLLAAQVLIIVLFPSTSPGQGSSASNSAGGSPAVGFSGTAGGAGDRTHCSGGREFSTSIDYYAPPCTPGTIGGSDDNGGSTSQGVTNNTITVVDYYADAGGIVDTILRAEGLYVDYAQTKQVNNAFQNFVNSHYVLWGRKLKIETYNSTCQTVPPDTGCLLAEMDSIVQTYHPYAVDWGTTLCSVCFSRLAQDHTIAIGGVGFSAAFAQANAPYFWSPGESSTNIEQGFAKFWCNQLTSKNTNRVVSFAQDKNAAQNFNGQKRVLGVISTNDPDNEDTVTNVLVPALNRDCGDGGSVAQHHYFYSQDISTAAQQINAGVSAMDTANDPATDVVCLCDPVAPELLYSGEQQHNYYPENILADVQGMGVDAVAQNFESTPTQQSIACAQWQAGCEFDNAFGITSAAPLPPPSQEAGPIAFRLGGGTNLPMQPYVATGAWEQWNMLASLIENTGPDLTPARMASAAPSMGTIGGGTTDHAELGFSKGSYNWTIDARVVYWSKTTPSPYNKKPGTYVDIESSRFLPQAFPKLSEPPIPKARSS
ncbi:MAG TPA: hypothetical protein VMU64_14385 [Acidimicrobiales bacterium]|nr:hypothetical protein [Acidimicrobiales bacterium]